MFYRSGWLRCVVRKCIPSSVSQVWVCKDSCSLSNVPWVFVFIWFVFYGWEDIGEDLYPVGWCSSFEMVGMES